MTLLSETKDNSGRNSVIVSMDSGVSALPKTFILSKHQVLKSAVFLPHLLSQHYTAIASSSQSIWIQYCQVILKWQFHFKYKKCLLFKMGFILIFSSVLRILKIYLLLFLSSIDVHAICFPQTVVLSISNLTLKRERTDTHLLSSFSLMSTLFFVRLVGFGFLFVLRQNFYCTLLYIWRVFLSVGVT